MHTCILADDLAATVHLSYYERQRGQTYTTISEWNRSWKRGSRAFRTKVSGRDTRLRDEAAISRARLRFNYRNERKTEWKRARVFPRRAMPAIFGQSPREPASYGINLQTAEQGARLRQTLNV